MNLNKPSLPAFCILILLCLTSLVILACGKTGMPRAKNTAQDFELAAIAGSIVNNCLAVTGQFQGAYQNLEQVRLEVDNLEGTDEDCIECPFVPIEVLFFDELYINISENDGTFGFSYCPQSAKGYRWRLAGISTYNKLPHTISAEQITFKE